MDEHSIDRRRFIKAASAAGIAGLAGCMGGSSKAQVTMGVTGQGSSTTAAGQALSRAVNQESDTLDMPVQQTDGWVANAYLYDDDELEAAGIDNNTISKAKSSRSPFDEEPVDDIPYQGFIFTSLHIHLVAVDGSGIETTDDLAGKTVYPIQPGYGTRLLTEEVFERGGIADEVDYLNVDTSDVPGAIQEDRVDALAVYGSDFVNLSGWVQQIDTQADVHLVELTDEFEQGIRDSPGARYVEFEPYGWSQDVTQVTDTVTSWALDGQWWFGPDISADAAYEIARVSSEHSNTVRESDESYPDHSDPADMTNAIIPDIPIHEGVADFYKDEGVWDDSWTVGEANE